MKKLILTILVLAVFVGAFAYLNKDIVTSVKRWANSSFCDRPIKYKISSIDKHFDITDKQLEVETHNAAGIWNELTGKTIFEPDENGELTINLVYDGRQQIVTTINDLGDTVEQKKQALEKISTSYDKQRAQLEARIQELNKQIDYWNSRGGAPLDEYNRLVKEQKELQKQVSELNALGNNYNKNVTEVNEDIHKLNNTVTSFNNLIDIKPEEGLYTSGENKIDIYFYGSREELIHVLAHEMGHALGLGHINADNAIMNPVTSDNIKPTEADKSEITKFCANKNRIDLIKHDLQNLLYTLSAKVAVFLNAASKNL